MRPSSPRAKRGALRVPADEVRKESARSTPFPGVDADNPLFVASIAKCFQVLETLNAAGVSLPLTEITARSKLERSAVQRITHTLKTLGYLRQHPVARGYTLSGRMLEFGYTVLTTDRLREKAYPFLEALNRSTGETVNLMELEGNDVVYIARFPSVHAVSVDLHVGSRLPSFCTAAGRAILSRLDPAHVLARLGDSPRTPMTQRTVTDIGQLTHILGEVRRLGYALNDQEAFVGDISVAAPLIDRAGAVVGAINIAVPTPRWKVDEVRRVLAPLVVKRAREISSELGVL